MKTRSVAYIAWFIGGLLAMQPAAFAQSTSAQITGTITDPSGAVVPQASIRVVQSGTGLVRETQSNDAGNYVVPLLPPGKYRITAEKQGFKPMVRPEIELQVDQVARIDFVLQVGDATQTVEVAAPAPLLDQETSALGQVIDNRTILQMPLNGRMAFRLVQLTSGVLTTASSNGQFGDISVGTFDDNVFSVNGGRARTNEVMVDGVPSTTGFLNLFTHVPSVDSTQEFKVQSNAMSAEWGRFGGGVINVSTRSGTNQFHGSLFEFFRNSAMDANDFFNKRAGKDTPPFRMNQFGGTLGGPVSLGKIYNGRNRTFFFIDYEGTRWRRGDVYITTAPSALERSGNFTQTLTNTGQMIQIYDPVTTRANPAQAGQFVRDPFPGNVIPPTRLDPVGVNLVKFYPAPNTAGDPFTATNNFVSNAARRINKDSGGARLDHSLKDSWRIFGRLGVTRTLLHQPDHFNNEATPGVGANGDIVFHYYTAALDNTITLSPNTLLDVRYGFARFYWSRATRSFGFDQTKLGLPEATVRNFQIPVFPVISVEGYSAMGGGTYLKTGQDTHSLLPSVTKNAGRHILKMGADLRLRRNNLFVISNGGGTYSSTRPFTRGPNPNVFTANAGNGVATLLLGVAASGSVNSIPGVSLQNWYYAGYLQDDIKISSRLTLNLGVRYETESPYTERRQQLAWFDFDIPSPAKNAAFPNLKGGLRFPTVDTPSRYVYDWDKNNFSPRVGLAYTFLPQTVFRAGFGVFYSPLETNNDLNAYTPVLGTGFVATTPFVGSLDGLKPFRYLSNPFPDGLVKPTGSSAGAATLLGQEVRTWDYAARTPYTAQWNASLQHQFGGTLLVEAAYAASRGVKLARGYQRDTLDPRYLSLGAALQQLVDNPFAGTITVGALAQPQVTRRQLLLPYPQFNGVNVINSGSADSVYHSLQMKVEKRFSHGYTFLVSYTAGKLITDAVNSLTGLGLQASGTGVQDWYNLRAERSLSEMDQAQALTVSSVVDLPFGQGRPLLNGFRGVRGKLLSGWQLGGILTYRSGYPLSLSAPITGGGNRPNSTGVSAHITSSRSRGEKVARWFDISQFTIPPAFSFGNVSRTLPDVRGPALANLDASLVKNTRLREKTELQFRAEFFNATNRAHLGLPNTAAGSLQFGQISSTAALPRVLQFALKLTF